MAGGTRSADHSESGRAAQRLVAFRQDPRSYVLRRSDRLEFVNDKTLCREVTLDLDVDLLATQATSRDAVERQVAGNELIPIPLLGPPNARLMGVTDFEGNELLQVSDAVRRSIEQLAAPVARHATHAPRRPAGSDDDAPTVPQVFRDESTIMVEVPRTTRFRGVFKYELIEPIGVRAEGDPAVGVPLSRVKPKRRSVRLLQWLCILHRTYQGEVGRLDCTSSFELRLRCLDDIEIVNGTLDGVEGTETGSYLHFRQAPTPGAAGRLEIRLHVPIGGLCLPGTLLSVTTTLVLLWLAIDAWVRPGAWIQKGSAISSLVPALIVVPTLVSVLVLRTNEHRLVTSFIRGLRLVILIPAAAATVVGFTLGLSYDHSVEVPLLFTMGLVSSTATAALIATMLYWRVYRRLQRVHSGTSRQNPPQSSGSI